MEPQYGKYLANHFRWLLWTWNHGFQIGGAAVRKSGGEDQTFLIFDQGLRDMIDLNFLIFNQGPRDMIDLNFPIFDQEPRDTEIQQKLLIIFLDCNFPYCGLGGALWVHRDYPDFWANTHLWARTNLFPLIQSSRGYRDSLLESAQENVTIGTAAKNGRNRCDSKDILSAFLFGSRIASNCALSEVSLMHPQSRPFSLQQFLDFRAIFSPDGPSLFWSSRFTK